MPAEDPFDDFTIPVDPPADLDRATQELTVHTDERRYGKQMVVIEGFDSNTDLDDLAAGLKYGLRTGRTAKVGRIARRSRGARPVAVGREGVSDKRLIHTAQELT